MSGYTACSDDYYVNMNLNTEMELPQARETVLHFFEQVRKQYPSMRNFYARERGELVLEEGKDSGSYRWVGIEPRRVSSGVVNPHAAEDAFEQHLYVLDQAPYSLTVSPLDCESLNLTFGFDFTYRGNHNEVLIDALGVVPGFERMLHIPGALTICHEPSIQFALDDDCRYQCRLSIETRTTAYHIRTGEFPEEQLSVYFTARRYGALDTGETLVSVMKRLGEICTNILDRYVVDNVLRPLQEAIAIK